MRRLLSAAAMVGALMVASAANASSLFFEFDEALSSITITSNTPNCLPGFGCQLSAMLETPFSSFTINEGDTATFDFATFFVSPGFGFENDARVDAVLAFITPDASPATTGGSANYLRLGGFFRPGVVAGNLIWDNPVQQVTTADGSLFSVRFGNLQGVTFGGNATSSVSITVDSVAVPEPATWALMIGGFGLAGATLRRRLSLAAG
jgi:hypothetical protein